MKNYTDNYQERYFDLPDWGCVLCLDAKIGTNTDSLIEGISKMFRGVEVSEISYAEYNEKKKKYENMDYAKRRCE